MTSQNLDDLDRRILNLRQREGALSIGELAVRVGSTTATCHRRLQRLRQNGYLRDTIVLADARRSTEPITVVIGITMTEQSAANQEALRKWIREESAVRSAWVTTGDFDYMVIIALSDVSEIIELTDRLTSSTRCVRSFRTFVGMETLKMDLHRRF